MFQLFLSFIPVKHARTALTPNAKSFQKFVSWEEYASLLADKEELEEANKDLERTILQQNDLR